VNPELLKEEKNHHKETITIEEENISTTYETNSEGNAKSELSDYFSPALSA